MTARVVIRNTRALVQVVAGGRIETGGGGGGVDVASVDGRTGTVVLSDLYQPLDSDLTAIAALTTTAFGRGLLELANAGAARTALDAEQAGTAAAAVVAHIAAGDPHPGYALESALGAAALLGVGTTAGTVAAGDHLHAGVYDPAGTAAAAVSAHEGAGDPHPGYLTEAAAASGYQPLDSDLTAVAALTTTAFGRGLLELANAGAARTALGLAIGSDVGAYDAGLASLAGVDTGAGLLAYTTGVDAWAGATLTAAGRALLDDADASAQRTTLGLGTIATQAASAVAITGGTVAGITDLAIADGGTGASSAAAARTALGIEQYTTLVLSADESNSTTTEALVAGLSFTPEVDAVYHVEYVLAYTAAAAATGITHRCDHGNAAEGAGWFAGRGAAYTSQVVSVPTLSGSFPASGTSSGAGWTLAWGQAVIRAAGASPTAVGVSFASEVAASAVTLKGGACFLRYRRLS